jgi:hypothetical protein
MFFLLRACGAPVGDAAPGRIGFSHFDGRLAVINRVLL